MASILSILLVLIISLVLGLSRMKADITNAPIDIGFEHTTALGLDITLTVGGDHPIFKIGQDGNETAYINLPSSWTRKEVQHANLSDIKSEVAELSYNRWNLPQGAVITFEADAKWQDIILHNPSRIAYKIRLTTVDLEKDSADYQVILAKDESVHLLHP